jgi:hypothetical protein
MLFKRYRSSMAGLVLMILAVSVSVHGRSESKKADQGYRDFVRGVLENTRSQENLLNVLKNSEISPESYRVIENDLMRRFKKDARFPKFTLVRDQVVIDTIASGLKITSYSPLQIDFRGRPWRYDLKMSPDENYLALMDFIGQQKTRSAGLAMFFPQAHAYGPFLAGAVLTASSALAVTSMAYMKNTLPQAPSYALGVAFTAISPAIATAAQGFGYFGRAVDRRKEHRSWNSGQ